MPVANLLILVGDVQQARLFEVIADEVQPHGQVVGESDRYRGRGQARQVDAGGVDVAQIHGDGVAGFLSELEGHRRSRRSREHVAILESTLKVFADAPAKLLRLEIVSVVVARGEHIGADHDASLDLRAKSLAACALVHVDEIRGPFGTIAEAHTVVAGQIR